MLRLDATQSDFEARFLELLDMKRENDTTLKRVEEIAKTHDAIARARAASPVAGGKDRLDRLDPGFQRLNGL